MNVAPTSPLEHLRPFSLIHHWGYSSEVSAIRPARESNAKKRVNEAGAGCWSSGDFARILG
jgi:hypothetical protein